MRLFPGVTQHRDHTQDGPPNDGNGTTRIDDPRESAGDRSAAPAEHDELRRTFARQIDCSVNDVRGAASRGGRRKPVRGRGGGFGGGGHAA